MRPNDWSGRPWNEDTDWVKRTVNKFYGAEAFENKEDTKMNDTQGMYIAQQTTDNGRREIMNKLKVGDKICTNSNPTTPMEIFAFDYLHLRVGVTYHISCEGYEKVGRVWVDPLTITDPVVRNRVSYTNYYSMRREQKKVNHIPTPKKIIVNAESKVTVVLWDDGTKTVVRCSEADVYDPYAAYCAAFAKKCYGTNSQLKKTIEKLTVYQEEKENGRLPTMEEFVEVLKKFDSAFGNTISEES